MNKPIIGIISPCFNEELVLHQTSLQLNLILEDLIIKHIMSDKSFIAFIDDGSVDKTWKIIEDNSNKFSSVKGLKLAKNVGHQNALLTGLLTYKENADTLIYKTSK